MGNNGFLGNDGEALFTFGLLRVSWVIAQNEVLDTLLLFAVGLLLRFHGNCKAGIGRQLNCACLDKVSMDLQP